MSNRGRSFALLVAAALAAVVVVIGGIKSRATGPPSWRRAVSEIGPEVKAGVGPAMYAGRSATCEEWLAEVTRVVTAIIDTPNPT
jgi:hypothetical protein